MTQDDDLEADSTDSSSPSKPWMKFAGLGMELASYSLGLAAIGYVIDLQRGHDKPYGAAAGTLVGFAFGMFRFIQRVSQTPQ
ncbi:Putative F0F1-ATPase subunit (ATPase_gene1) [Planctomycetes bacterium K23_9]|uniref:F0F1-ATPase subunit (ATPase_gene1) n=2 Tax=Stieleria marina TaxID=1930275 RepID=A0A517P1I8_9BACT|nr:Putative F0F1-ATPase subunit (ATPase_gene1) [Planctomycetes bacterium K23_9]